MLERLAEQPVGVLRDFAVAQTWVESAPAFAGIEPSQHRPSSTVLQTLSALRDGAPHGSPSRAEDELIPV
jgi:hypothetical protein